MSRFLVITRYLLPNETHCINCAAIIDEIQIGENELTNVVLLVQITMREEGHPSKTEDISCWRCF